MQILYHHRIRSKDGQFVHLEELVLAFRALGHEVTLVGPSIVATSQFGADAGYVDTLRARIPGAVVELIEFAYSLIAMFRLFRCILRRRPDFIYERFKLFFPVGALVSKLTGIPLALEVNGPLFEERLTNGGLSWQRLARWSQAWVWRNAELVLPVTEVLAAIAVRYGVHPARVLVLHNGVALERYRKLSNPEAKAQLALENRLVLGFVGFVRAWHAVDRVIDLLASGALPPEACLVIVGDGPAIASLRAMTQKRKLDARVLFAGVVPRDRVPMYLAAFDIALQPAVTDYASPLKVIEYLAAGKAILAPDQPNIRELLTDDDNALLFRTDDPTAFTSALMRLSIDKALRARLELRAYETIARLALLWTENASKVVSRMRPT